MERQDPSEFAVFVRDTAKRALDAGMHFHVDILDTWNMTITPVDRDFVTAPTKGSNFPATGDGKIDLPGKKYIALRIVRTNETSPK